MDGVSVSEPAFYKSLYILGTFEDATRGGSTRAELDGPIDPFEPPASPDGQIQTRPAFGVLTVHRQSWVQKGIALGNVIQSVCLAPGEVTQVAVIDWRRQTSGSSTDTAEQGEAVISAIDQQRAVNEVQQAVAREAQSGQSSASASSASTQASLSGASLMVSGSTSAAASTSTALTAQFSTGARNLAAQSSNALSQKTAERSSALRSRRSTVVREVSEHETETLSSRVLVNYNRRHTLNIEYFEVLQLYALTTQLHSWERCVFVPLKPIDFSNTSEIVRHRANLHSIFESLDRLDLIPRLTSDFDAAARAKSLDVELEKLRADICRYEAESNEHQRMVDVFRDALAHLRVYKSGELQRNPSLAKRGEKDYRNIADKNKDYFTGNIATESEDDLQHKQIDRATARDVAKQLYRRRMEEFDKLKAERSALNLSLAEYLDANRLFLSQQLWLRMDAYQNYRMLSRYKVEEQALVSHIDPHPIGVFGNYLAFRWGFGDDRAARDAFEKAHISDGVVKKEEVVEAEIALPTSGVFAEAVLGRGEAAEKKDNTRLWQWQSEAQIPILPPKIADIASRDRAKGIDLSSAQLAAPLAALRATDMPNISNLGGLLQQVGNGNLFRDMGGLLQTMTLADKLAGLSGAGATEAGKRSQEIHAKFLDTFIEFIESDAGKAAISEAILPGSGVALLTNRPATPARSNPKSSSSLSGSAAGSPPSSSTAAAAARPNTASGQDDLDSILGAPDPS
jgi:hypothetical protein